MRTAHGRMAMWMTAFVLAGVCAPLARGQVWVDETQLGGRSPVWVDHSCYVPPPPCTVKNVWIEATYRMVCHRTWHEAVYQTVTDRVWTDGHYELHAVTVVDPRGCSSTHYDHVWVAGFYTNVQRQVFVSPGFWETTQTRELVSPGHFETLSVTTAR